MTTYSINLEPLYVLDTHPLIWHLKQDNRLSPRANYLFEAAKRGDTRLIMSAIVVAEMYYADKKWQLFDDFFAIYTAVKAEPYFRFVPFHADDVVHFPAHIAIPEMHDKIIAGLAWRLGAPLVTADTKITASGVVRIVW